MSDAYERVRAIVTEIADHEHTINKFPSPENYEKQAQNWNAWDDAMAEYGRGRWDEGYSAGLHDGTCDLC